MPALPVIAAVVAGVGAAATVIGTIGTINAQNRMARAQKQQYKFERQMQQNRTVRERRDAIRAARLTGGALTQTAENQGASGTSAAMGSLGSIVSQLNSNLSFLDTNQKLRDRAGEQSAIAARASASSQNWGAVSQLGQQIFSMSGRIG